MNELKDLLEREIQAIKNIPLNGAIEKAIELIYQKTHLQNGKVVISGVGKAGHIALQFSASLCSTGTPSCFLNPLDAQHGDLGILQEHDVLFTISNSGLTRELIELNDLARKLRPNIPIIVLTKESKNSLATQADVVILTGDTKEICPLDLTPTTSTTIMKVISDILVVSLMKKKNFTKEMYAKRHHGGYLGTKSKK